ncbi:MAG: hypothetical protein FMNOHCHN_01743 [Ignavibacteriaceae bacterium]|nr:hypothetical protein [Ignavibacteriaceae bacterium]
MAERTSSPALLLGKEKGAGKFLLTRFYNILQKTSSLTLLLRKEKGVGKSGLYRFYVSRKNLIPSPSPWKGEGGRKISVNTVL